MGIHFAKYHALGNDYLVLAPEEFPEGLSAEQVRTLCHRNFGVGSDGILYGPQNSPTADFGLSIFNPDGSEAEKSGNGLRIFARYLWDRQLVTHAPFTIMTKGGKVVCQVHPEGRAVTVAMGQVSFDSRRIPVVGPPREVINEEITIDNQTLRFCAATVGNPHCVVLRDTVDEATARHFGPPIERDARFPNRTNVQFLQVLDRHHIRIEIWERGAGYTLASGSSSCAAAAVAHRLGLCDADIQVHMPGGVIRVAIGSNHELSMTGAVTRVAEGRISEEILSR